MVLDSMKSLASGCTTRHVGIAHSLNSCLTESLISDVRIAGSPSTSFSRGLHAQRPCQCSSFSTKQAGGKQWTVVAAHSDNQGLELTESPTTRRRQVLVESAVAAAIAAFGVPSGVLAAEEESHADSYIYEDSADRYSLLVPAGWEKGEGKAGTRKVVAFYPPGNSANTNVNLVITMLGADFTSMGSFGTADNFGENLVNSLDRSWKRPPGQAAKLVSTKSSQGMYYVEYTIQKVGEEKRHFVSVVGMNNNGIYNRLFTLTGQYMEEDSAKFNGPINQAISSFKLAS